MRLVVAKLQHYLLIEIQDERLILRPTRVAALLLGLL